MTVDDPEGWFRRNADRTNPKAAINYDPTYFASECADAIMSGKLARQETEHAWSGDGNRCAVTGYDGPICVRCGLPDLETTPKECTPAAVIAHAKEVVARLEESTRKLIEAADACAEALNTSIMDSAIEEATTALEEWKEAKS